MYNSIHLLALFFAVAASMSALVFTLWGLLDFFDERIATRDPAIKFDNRLSQASRAKNKQTATTKY